MELKMFYGKLVPIRLKASDSNLNVLELKREKTPREVVAQVLDYGSWVSTLTRDEVIGIAGLHLRKPLEVAFEEVFGTAPPDELNTGLRLTVVAAELDSSSERIVTYLRDFGVPINAVFFSFLQDEDRRYLARSWLVSSEDGGPGAAAPPSTRGGTRAEWNGRDWFVSFGEHAGGRSWADGERLGFVSAGGDPWYSQTLRNVPVGARVNVHIPGRGYVAVGITLDVAHRFDEAEVLVDGQWLPLAEQDLVGDYRHGDPAAPATDENAEYVIPVRWLVHRPTAEAYWEKGMFANQNSACKLRQEFTLDRLNSHFALDEIESEA